MLHENTTISDNIYVLRQGNDLLKQIETHHYTTTPHLAYTSSVGGHMRHCIDFYHCFLRDLETGRIDYDLRERNELISTDRQFAAAQIQKITQRLEQLHTLDAYISVIVRMDDTRHSDTNEASFWSHSSMQRELQFLLSHTIHHYALIATLLRMQGFEPGKAFGVAPATLEHWRRMEEPCAY